MNTTNRPLGVTLNGQPAHSKNQRRYANILCCLRDDMKQKSSPALTLDDTALESLVKEHYHSALSSLEWEDATVQMLKTVASCKAHSPIKNFADSALSHLRQITPNSYVWLQ